MTCCQVLGKTENLSGFCPSMSLAHFLAVMQEEDHAGEKKFGGQVCVQRSQEELFNGKYRV